MRKDIINFNDYKAKKVMEQLVVKDKELFIALMEKPFAEYDENDENLFDKEEIIDMAFSELYTNAQSILRTLAVCGVTGKVLDSTELADLLYVAYNRDESELLQFSKALDRMKNKYDDKVKQIEAESCRMEKVSVVIKKSSSKHNRGVTDNQKKLSAFIKEYFKALLVPSVTLIYFFLAISL